MPQNNEVARSQWLRYVYARDTGHIAYLRKAVRCEDFVAGEQWLEEDRMALRAAKRPALTINKTLITLASIVGEQIETRNEIAFRPRSGAAALDAELHTKVFRHIGDSNQLDWVRTAVFSDGAVTSRGYYDVRLDFSKNLAGDVAITQLNPRNVLPDPDASDLDPDKWNDVIVTSWMTADDIEILYNKPDADALRHRADSAWAYGYDSIDMGKDRFGSSFAADANISEEMRPMLRNLRVIERQHRVLKKQKMFVDVRNGMKRDVPETWTAAQVQQMLAENPHLIVITEVAKRIRWTVTCDDFVLHDEWSPYKHFTVVPYFPVFRYGRTVGLIEGLLDPQELLNKTISQELHVVNTMANSGWKVRHGAIMNMTMEELEEVGAKTGLVLEIQGDPDKDVVKIMPNAIPTGLDRISFKAENFIKSISGRGDSVMGLDRADVSGDAIAEKKQSSDVPLRPALDNLVRTDWLMARNVLDIVQQYYTDPRILNITHDDITGEVVEVSINQPRPGTGEVMNDLSLGEFNIVVVSQQAKRTLEESQFQQGIAMRELGIAIPDRFLIQNSNLIDKDKIVKAMDEAAKSEAAVVAEQAKVIGTKLELANLKAEVSETEARATLARAKSADTLAKATKEAANVDSEQAIEASRHAQEMQHMREKAALELQIAREKAAMEAQVRAAEAREKMRQAKLDTVMKAKQVAATPKSVNEAATLARASGKPVAEQAQRAAA